MTQRGRSNMPTPPLDGESFVFSLILGAVARGIPADARQRIANGEQEVVLEQTVGAALLQFNEFVEQLGGGR
jgi:hypothetical protein